MSRFESVRKSLEWALDAAGAPALYLVWQDDARDTTLVLEACGAAHKAVRVAEELAGGRFLSLLDEPTLPGPEVVVVPGGLSSVHTADRPWINLARNRLLLPDREVVLIEPADQESVLRRDFPDIMSVVRDSFHANRPTYEGDDAWNTGGTGRFSAIAASLPPVFTVGSIVVDHGKAQFKGPLVASCPRCGGAMKQGPTMLTFRFAPAQSQTQAVEGWLCSCGERYVPGEAAREAYRRAFGR